MTRQKNVCVGSYRVSEALIKKKLDAPILGVAPFVGIFHIAQVEDKAQICLGVAAPPRQRKNGGEGTVTRRLRSNPLVIITLISPCYMLMRNQPGTSSEIRR